MPATLVGGRDRGEEERGNKEKAESPKKPPADHVRNSIHGALLRAGVFALTAIGSTRLRSSRSKWNSIPLVQIAQTEPVKPVPCFASLNIKWGCITNLKRDRQKAPVEASSRQSQQQPPKARASA